MDKIRNQAEILNSSPDPNDPKNDEAIKDEAIKEEIISEAEKIIEEKGEEANKLIEMEREKFNTKKEEALRLADTIKKDLIEQSENAIKEINKQHAQDGERYQKDKSMLQEQQDDLTNIKNILAKLSKSTEIYHQWKNEGTVAQLLATKYLIKRWVEKYKKQYDELKKAYDEKWDKE